MPAVQIKVTLSKEEFDALPDSDTAANRVRLGLGLAKLDRGGVRAGAGRPAVTVNESDDRPLGLQLRGAIRRSSLTRQQVAQRFGINISTLSAWCAGTQRPSVENRARIRAFIARPSDPDFQIAERKGRKFYSWNCTCNRRIGSVDPQPDQGWLCAECWARLLEDQTS